MVYINEVKSIMLCERKSFEQSLFLYLRTIHNLSIKDLARRIGISLNVLKRAEGDCKYYKRLPISIARKILSYYNITEYEYDYLKKESYKGDISIDYIVEVYHHLFNFSKTKSLLYVHSKINGLSKKEYQKIIRISRVNLQQTSLKFNDICKNLLISKQISC